MPFSRKVSVRAHKQTKTNKRNRVLSSPSSGDNSQNNQTEKKKPPSKKVNIDKAPEGNKTPAISSFFQPSKTLEQENMAEMAGTMEEEEQVVEIQTEINEKEMENTQSDKMQNEVLKKLCSLDSKMDRLNETLQELRGDLHEVRMENENLKKELERCKKKQEELKSTITEVKFAANLALKKAGELAQYSRRKNCKIMGIPEEADSETAEESEKKVIRLLRESMGLKVSGSDIELCHRLGPKRDKDKYPRPIIVRFVTRKSKIEVMRAKKTLTTSKSAVFIVEDLTPENYALLREAKSHPNAQKAWANYRGKVFVKTQNDAIVTVTEKSDLSKLSATVTQLHHLTTAEANRQNTTHATVKPREPRPAASRQQTSQAPPGLAQNSGAKSKSTAGSKGSFTSTPREAAQLQLLSKVIGENTGFPSSICAFNPFQESDEDSAGSDLEATEKDSPNTTGFLFPPKRTRKSTNGLPEDVNDASANQRDSCYDNPAFSIQDAVDAEEGRVKVSPKRTSSPKKKSPTKENQKTWTSLPGQDDISEGLHRQGSCGSLDNNYGGPESVSVWLQSQDIIGLGFNISGNMRDGIFVSQVHNRGPAIESGKIKVGDRIVSVTIAYDNIVYEDALTILSYASPYPVKVTVQKERAITSDSRVGSNEQLNHPLYRSQSLDALQRIGKEPPFRPKRTQSEMKSDTRKLDSPRKARGDSTDDRWTKGLAQTYSGTTDYSGTFDVSSDVLVHAADAVDGRIRLDGYQPVQEVVTSVRRETVESAPPPQSSPQEDAEASAGREKSRLDTEAAREFASLMDQMLDAPGKKDGDEDRITSQSAASVSTSPKTPPSKPERKKKPSNSSIVSFDESLDFVIGGSNAVEETFQAATAVAAQALPRSTEDLGPEAEEEEIQASFVKRDIVIGSDTIEFTPVENREPADRSPSPSNFFNLKMSARRRPASPDEDPVEEELIEAAVASRDSMAAPLPSSSRSQTKTEDAGVVQEKKKKKEKEKEKKPAIDERELERLIAMNAFPPGSQGLAGITEGGKQGGVFDDFMARDAVQLALNGQFQAAHARSGSSSSEASSQSQRNPRGGVAFEVRDDVTTGRPVSVDISRGSLNSSSSASTSRSGSRDRMARAGPLHDDHQHRHGLAEDKENREDGLDWSGKRLVRSGSFPEIPQDDSLSDWTDKNKLNDDDDNSTTSGKRSTADTNPDSDSEMDPPRTLPGRDVFKARENLANMSDLSNSMSSSRSSSPAVTNGPADGVNMLSGPVTGGVGGVKNATIELAPPTSDTNANSKTIGVTLHASTEDDMDC